MLATATDAATADDNGDDNATDVDTDDYDLIIYDVPEPRGDLRRANDASQQGLRSHARPLLRTHPLTAGNTAACGHPQQQQQQQPGVGPPSPHPSQLVFVLQNPQQPSTSTPAQIHFAPAEGQHGGGGWRGGAAVAAAAAYVHHDGNAFGESLEQHADSQG